MASSSNASLMHSCCSSVSCRPSRADLLLEHLLDVDAADDGLGERVGVALVEVVGLASSMTLSVVVEELVLLELLDADVVDHAVGDAAGLLVGHLRCRRGRRLLERGWP